MPLWEKPLYRLKSKQGKEVIIDVTLSVNPNLSPNKAIEEVAAFFQAGLSLRFRQRQPQV